jgi:tRNA dimethylallyltransferase
MRLPVLLGPTAVGKTELAIRVASRLDAEIVSADSRQVYRLLDIGTAKPTREELDTVTHHMIDVVDPDQPFGAGQYGRAAIEVIEKLWSGGRIAIVVGGSGLYLRALLEGLFSAPPVDATLRKEIIDLAREKGTVFLHERLKIVDPEAARRIHPNDLQRISRAIEVYEQTGTPISLLQKSAGGGPFEPLYIGLWRGRAELNGRIERRVERMVELGFAEEVEGLLNLGYQPSLNSFRAVGYREMVEYVLKRRTLGESIARTAKNTRALARRQLTWFKQLKDVEWVDLSEYGEKEALKTVRNLIEQESRGGF